jgi:hypothetical protein
LKLPVLTLLVATSMFTCVFSGNAVEVRENGGQRIVPLNFEDGNPVPCIDVVEKIVVGGGDVKRKVLTGSGQMALRGDKNSKVSCLTASDASRYTSVKVNLIPTTVEGKSVKVRALELIRAKAITRFNVIYDFWQKKKTKKSN